MAFEFNPAEYDAADTIKPVPPGVYQVTVVDANDKPSRNGSEMITAKLEILGPTHARRYLWWRLVNSGDYVQKNLGDLLASIGMGVGEAADVTPRFLIGKTGHVRVVVGEWEGKPTADVKGWTADVGTAFDPPATGPGPAAAPQERMPAGPPTSVDEDGNNIPF